MYSRASMLRAKAGELRGIEIDQRAVSHVRRLTSEVPEIREVRHYDGRNIPCDADTFDVVTCTDVIEHVPDYMGLIMEMIRVSKRVVFLSTPNRRPEYTRSDGRPKNRWHLREWTWVELKAILAQLGFEYECNFINGPFEGPFTVTTTLMEDTLSLVPAILIKEPTE